MVPRPHFPEITQYFCPVLLHRHPCVSNPAKVAFLFVPREDRLNIVRLISVMLADNQFSLSTKASPMNIPMKPMRPPMRSSIEGLNQEIEGLVLKNVTNTSDADHPVEDKVELSELF